MNLHGIGYSKLIGVLSDGQALPNAGAADSTNMVDISGRTGGRMYIGVYANNAVEIATGQAFSIELQAFTADTAASAVAPFSSESVLEPAHYYPLYKTSADAALAWIAGELITEIPVPENMLGLMSYDFVQLVYTTDADESDDDVDAFVYYR